MTTNHLRKAVIALFVSLEILCFILLPFAAQEAKAAESPLRVEVTKVSAHNYRADVIWKGKRQSSYRFNRKPSVVFANTNKLTYERLTNRKRSELIIEVMTGKQINFSGDGILFTKESNYIRYHGFRKGDVIRTYCVYNPATKYFDDVTERFDEKIR